MDSDFKENFTFEKKITALEQLSEDEVSKSLIVDGMVKRKECMNGFVDVGVKEVKMKFKRFGKIEKIQLLTGEESFFTKINKNEEYLSNYQSARILWKDRSSAVKAVEACDKVMCRYLNNVLMLRLLQPVGELEITLEKTAAITSASTEPKHEQEVEIIEDSNQYLEQILKLKSDKIVVIIGLPELVMRTKKGKENGKKLSLPICATFMESAFRDILEEGGLTSMTDTKLLVKKERNSRPNVTGKVWTCEFGNQAHASTFISKVEGKVHEYIGHKDNRIDADSIKVMSWNEFDKNYPKTSESISEKADKKVKARENKRADHSDPERNVFIYDIDQKAKGKDVKSYRIPLVQRTVSVKYIKRDNNDRRHSEFKTRFEALYGIIESVGIKIVNEVALELEIQFFEQESAICMIKALDSTPLDFDSKCKPSSRSFSGRKKKMELNFTSEFKWIPTIFKSILHSNTTKNSEDRDVLIRFLPIELKPEKVKELYCKYGEIIEVQTKLVKNVMGAHYAMQEVRVIFTEKDSAVQMIKAVNMTSPDYLHRSCRTLTVKFYAESLKPEKTHDVKDESDNNVFVGNIPIGTTQNAVESIFERFGKIKSSKMLSKPSEKPVSENANRDSNKHVYICALIMFEEALSAEMAIIELNGKYCAITDTELVVRLRTKNYLEIKNLVDNQVFPQANGLDGGLIGNGLRNRRAAVTERVDYEYHAEYHAFARPPYGTERLNLIKSKMRLDINRHYAKVFF